MKPIFYTFLFLCLFWTTGIAQNASGELARLPDFYEQKLKESAVIGSSVWVLQNGRVIHEQYHGLKNKEKKLKINRNSIFKWNSITKTFAGLAIMQLRELGLLTLEDTVVHYIPELMTADNPFGSMEAVTIKHLLTQSSGFPESIPILASGPYPTSWDSLKYVLPELKIALKPGSKYGYSSLNILLLKRIVEVVTGENFEYYVEKNIFKPLGMFNSYFGKTPNHFLNDACLYYRQTGEAPFDPDTTSLAAEGSFSSSLPDMAWYLNFLLGNANKQLYDFVLKRESIQEMLKPYLQIEAGPDKRQTGFIFSMENLHGVRLYGHAGTQDDFNTQIYFDTKSNTAYLVANNTIVKGGRNLSKELKNNILRNYFLKTD